MLLLASFSGGTLENHSAAKHSSELICIERRYTMGDDGEVLELVRIIAEFPKGFKDWRKLIGQIETVVSKLYSEEETAT